MVQWSIFRGYVIVSLPKGRRVGTCSPLKIGQVPKKEAGSSSIHQVFRKGTQISASCFASGIPEFEVVPLAGHYEETNAANGTEDLLILHVHNAEEQDGLNLTTPVFQRF